MQVNLFSAHATLVLWQQRPFPQNLGFASMLLGWSTKEELCSGSVPVSFHSCRQGQCLPSFSKSLSLPGRSSKHLITPMLSTCNVLGGPSPLGVGELWLKCLRARLFNILLHLKEKWLKLQDCSQLCLQSSYSTRHRVDTVSEYEGLQLCSQFLSPSSFLLPSLFLPSPIMKETMNVRDKHTVLLLLSLLCSTPCCFCCLYCCVVCSATDQTHGSQHARQVL